MADNKRRVRDTILKRKNKGKRGLWDNIHAKRKRGEKPAKPGSKAYPDARAWMKTKRASKRK
tara:strand:+ start:1768 stop:1953 length:186 start_codon:yes stop_codon:yes gene_type:complete